MDKTLAWELGPGSRLAFSTDSLGNYSSGFSAQLLSSKEEPSPSLCIFLRSSLCSSMPGSKQGLGEGTVQYLSWLALLMLHSNTQT